MAKCRVFIEMVIEAKDEEEAEDWAVHSIDEHAEFEIDRIDEA